MRILLDTHIFLWFISGSERIPGPTRRAIRDGANDVYVSPVSVWEVFVKSKLGRIALPDPPEVYLPEQRSRHNFGSLPIDEQSVSQLAALPDIHRDPFDRLLICQAIEHDLHLATVDRAIAKYPVNLVAAS